MQKLIEIKDVTAGYGNKTVLKDVSLDVLEGDFLGIIGPNGGGKTTLLKVILGLLQPNSGTIRFYQDGKQVPFLRIGYLPQLNNIDKKCPISVRDVISSGLASEKRWIRGFNDQQQKRIDEVVAQMGLEELVKRPIGELSGGQLQRVLLGRSIVSDPQVLILDEPLAGLDENTQKMLIDFLKKFHVSGKTLIIITHNNQLAKELGTRFIRMNDKHEIII